MSLFAHVVKIWICDLDGERCIAGPGEDIEDLIQWHRVLNHMDRGGMANGHRRVWAVYGREGDNDETTR